MPFFKLLAFSLTIVSVLSAIPLHLQQNLYKVQLLQSQAKALDVNFPGKFDIWNQQVVSQAGQVADPVVELTLRTTPDSLQKVAQHQESRTLTEGRVRRWAGITFQVVQTNLLRISYREQLQMQKCRSINDNFIQELEVNSAQSNSFFKCFRPYNEISDFLDKLIEMNADLLTKRPISTTYEGRPIYGYTLTHGESKGKAVYIQALLRAREWLTTPTVIYTMASLIDGVRSRNSQVLEMLRKVDFIFVPINRHPLKSSYGVDLNRNFQLGFGHHDALRSPRSDNYCGEFPLSEPETAGIEAFLTELEGQLVAGVDVHAFGQLVVHPYVPPQQKHREQLKDIAASVTQAIRDKHNTAFRSVHGFQGPYSGGSFMDNLFLIHGKIPSLEFVVRGDNFLVDPEDIITSGEEIFDGIQAFTEEIEELVLS